MANNNKFILVNHLASALVIGFWLSFNFSAYGVEDVEFDMGFRYRLQSVDDPLRNDATASTLKLRAGSNIFFNQSISAQVELDHVHAFNDGYNSVTVYKHTSPIPDPEGTELNKLFLNFSGWNDWQVRLGRQPMSFANERHIGSADYWQKNQSFDALSIRYDNSLNMSVEYAYLESVQRIFGRDARALLADDDVRAPYLTKRPAGELGVNKHDSHLLNLNYRISHFTTLSGYFYHLDNQSWWAFSSQTAGLRLETSFKPAALKYRFAVELASQKDAARNPASYQAYYAMLESEVQYRSHRLSLTSEYIGEDNGVTFATSLGSNHKFQGWADVFSDYLSNTGMTNHYLTYNGRKGKLRWRGVYHYFYDNVEHNSIGTELDIELAYRYTRKWEYKLVFAKYFAKQGVMANPTSTEDLSTLFVSVAYNI